MELYLQIKDSDYLEIITHMPLTYDRSNLHRQLRLHVLEIRTVRKITLDSFFTLALFREEIFLAKHLG